MTQKQQKSCSSFNFQKKITATSNKPVVGKVFGRTPGYSRKKNPWEIKEGLKWFYYSVYKLVM